METVQYLLDKVYELPKDEFEAFDETYKRYRIEKSRAGFIKSYEDAKASKAKGELFESENIDNLLKWLND